MQIISYCVTKSNDCCVEKFLTLKENLHYRLIFELGKNVLKLVKFQNLVKKRCNVWKIIIALQLKFANVLIIVLRPEIASIFGSNLHTVT